MYTYLTTYLFVYSITHLAVQSASPWYGTSVNVNSQFFAQIKRDAKSRQVDEIHYVARILHNNHYMRNISLP
jgi:hypothetical protein